jgi:hypothetical protein
MFNRYSVTLTLLRSQLGTNPLSAHVMDQHILDRQRKLIAANSKTNKAINKYLDALDIPDDRKLAEVSLIVEELERMVGRPFAEDEKEKILAGTLDDLKETFAELDTKGTTVFFKDKAHSNFPMIGDHMIYGFLKAASEALVRALPPGAPKKQGVVLQSSSYTQSIINQHVRCDREFITFDKDIERYEDGTPNYAQRSIRAMTPQGPRISLMKSEQVGAGAKLNFILRVLENSPLNEEALRKMFDYGECTGLGQWRNSGRGSFTYTLEKVIEAR